MWVTKLMISQVIKRIFCPKTTKFGPKLAFLVIWSFGLGHAGLFGALFVGRLVVVACGLYLARHLFTLSLDDLVVVVSSIHKGFQRKPKTKADKGVDCIFDPLFD